MPMDKTVIQTNVGNHDGRLFPLIQWEVHSEYNFMAPAAATTTIEPVIIFYTFK